MLCKRFWLFTFQRSKPQPGICVDVFYIIPFHPCCKPQHRKLVVIREILRVCKQELCEMLLLRTIEKCFSIKQQPFVIESFQPSEKLKMLYIHCRINCTIFMAWVWSFILIYIPLLARKQARFIAFCVERINTNDLTPEIFNQQSLCAMQLLASLITVYSVQYIRFGSGQKINIQFPGNWFLFAE